MKRIKSRKLFLTLLATSSILSGALPAIAQSGNNDFSDRSRTTDVLTSEEAKKRTIAELQAFERNKANANRSLESKLQALAAESSAEESSALIQLLNTKADITEVPAATLDKNTVFLKPQQSHNIHRIPIEDNVFLKPMQSPPVVDVERVPTIQRAPIEESVFLKPMQTLPPN